MIDNLIILYRAYGYTSQAYDYLIARNQRYFDKYGLDSSAILSKLDDLDKDLKEIGKLIEQEKQKQGA